MPKKDGQKLIELYFKIKEMLAEVEDIKHNPHPDIQHFVAALDFAEEELDDAAHKLFKLSAELKPKELKSDKRNKKKLD